MRDKTSLNDVVQWSLRCSSQIIDPLQALKGLVGYSRYFRDWRRYSRLQGAETIRLIDAFPQLADHTVEHSIDAHYFYANGWAMRRIVGIMPSSHVDVASQAVFANLLGAIVPVTFVDYRPLNATISGLKCVQGNIVALPYEDEAIESLSCLHVAEHIGLGRYGDPLDPRGTERAAKELLRILAPGGRLYFVVPVGQPRLCFNAHRIHSASTIREYFAELEVLEFSGVHDDGRFVEHVNLTEFQSSNYACGMFCFKKPERREV